jgi:hypothetical protein
MLEELRLLLLLLLLLLPIHLLLLLSRMHALLFGVMLPSDVSCQIMRPYIGTVTKLAIIHVGRTPKYETRNLLVKTFHFIYYMTTFLKLNCFALDEGVGQGHQLQKKIKF